MINEKREITIGEMEEKELDQMCDDILLGSFLEWFDEVNADEMAEKRREYEAKFKDYPQKHKEVLANYYTIFVAGFEKGAEFISKLTGEQTAS